MTLFAVDDVGISVLCGQCLLQRHLRCLGKARNTHTKEENGVDCLFFLANRLLDVQGNDSLMGFIW